MFLIAGEALVDMVAVDGGAYLPVAGGAPYNFARALALQGLPAVFANPFSDDVFGRMLRDTLRASGARDLGAASAKPTSLALVSTDARGQPHYSFYRDGVADRDWGADRASRLQLDGVELFHTGALALVPPDHDVVLEAMAHHRARGALCSVDVNMRPQVAESLGLDPAGYRDAAAAVIAASDLVKVSDEDLLHLGLGTDYERAARSLLERGPQIVVLTRGAAGAHVLTRDAALSVAAPRVEVVDTVGAGDCFYAGFIAALQREGELLQLRVRMPLEAALQAALQHGAVCAAIDVTRKGCQPPTWNEARAWIPPSARNV